LLIKPGKVQLCETEIDCDLSLLFLGQPIWIGSRQCLYQGTFTVIDMPCSREDEMLLHVAPQGWERRTNVRLSVILDEVKDPTQGE